MAGQSYLFMSSKLDQIGVQQVQAGMEGLQYILNDYKKDALIQAEKIATYPGIALAVSQRNRDEINRLIQKSGMEADFIVMTDQSGHVLFRTDQVQSEQTLTNYANRSALQGTPLATIEEDPRYKLAIYGAVPVKNQEGQIMGTVLAGFNGSKDVFVDQVKSLFGVEATLFYGSTRLTTTIMKDGKRAVGTDLDPKIAEKVSKNGETYVGKADILGTPHATSYIPLLSPDHKSLGILFAGKDLTEISQAKQTLLFEVLGVVLLVLILGISSASYIVGKLTRSLESLVQLAQEISQGNLNCTSHQSLRDQDEIGKLAEAMFNLQYKLAQLLSHIGEVSDHMAATSEQLRTGAEHSAQSSRHIASTIEQMAYESQHHLTVMNTSYHSLTEMSQHIASVAQGTQETAQFANQTKKNTELGLQAVEAAMNQMSHIETTVSQTAQNVSALAGRSREIGQIVDTIAGIAGQTHLLALNAAIEAARAGEQGRGFAVVAEEVRKLAEESQSAAQKIADIIQQVQVDTEKTVKSMTKGTEVVSAGSGAVHQAERYFASIASEMARISEQVENMDETIMKICEKSEKMVALFQKVNDISTKASEKNQNIAAVAEEQSAATEEVAAASKEMASMAEQLRQEMDQFMISKN